MDDRKPGEPINWYRCPVSREDLARLNKRSNFWGFAQTLGYLGLLAATGTVAFVSSLYWPWYATVALVYLHGTCWHFLVNGFHELIHDSVFKSRWLNRGFLPVFSFLGHYNHIRFWASHTEHHKFTLHPPDDLEVVLPQQYTLKNFLKIAFVNVWGPYNWIKGNLRVARGCLDGQWDHHLFDDRPKLHKQAKNWARFMLLGHLVLTVVCFSLGLWMIPLLVTFAPYYGAGLHFLCNASQHVGLSDYTPDFRLCCRTIYLNPVFQFLYWHMNYHTEHHMYAAVPCYNLGKLHRLIKHDMPECPNGLYATWKQICGILKRQKTDPKYQYGPALPSPGKAQTKSKPTAKAKPVDPSVSRAAVAEDVPETVLN